MSRARGSSLIEIMISMVIVGVALGSAIRVIPYKSAASLRQHTSLLTNHRIIQDELQQIVDASDPLAPPRLVANLEQETAPFSNTTRPKLGTVAIVSARIISTPSLVEIVTTSSRAESNATSIATVNFAAIEPTAAIGCSTASCIELTCARHRCRSSNKSVLISEGNAKLQFVSLIYRVSEISVLYISERAALRKLTLLDGRITANQPVLDDVTIFSPRLSSPPNLHCATALEVMFKGADSPLLNARAVQSVCAPPLPLEFLRFQSR